MAIVFNDGTQSNKAFGGRVLSYPHTSYTDYSLSSNTYTTIWSGMTITPRSSSSKILIEAVMAGEFGTTQLLYKTAFNYTRNGSIIWPGTAESRNYGYTCAADNYQSDASNTPEYYHFRYIDSPNTTSSVTYTVGLRCGGSSGTWRMNRTWSDSDNNDYARLASICTITEILP